MLFCRRIVVLSYCRVAAYCHVIFFFNDTATTEIYTLSLHDALPISQDQQANRVAEPQQVYEQQHQVGGADAEQVEVEGKRSEEHTSELQSRQYLVCRLLLEKKKT